MKHKRAIVFAAYPKLAGKLKTIFSTAEDSIRRRLEDPPILRYGGWSLETLDRARIIRGEMIRVRNGDRKVIDLYRDGSLVFAGLADHTFLARGNSPDKTKIHSIGIVEIVYNFINFYKLVLEDFTEKPEEIAIRIDFRNMHLGGTKSYLLPYQHGSLLQLEAGINYAPDNNGTIIRSFRIEDSHVRVIAFEMLKEIYAWFGWEEDKIPYTKTDGALKMVDPEAMAKIK